MKIEIPWETGIFPIRINHNAVVKTLVPKYPTALPIGNIQRQIEDNLLLIAATLQKAQKILLILEDSSRFSNTADIITFICKWINRLRGKTHGLELIIAAGAHYNISSNELKRKIGNSSNPVTIHDCRDNSGLLQVGTSKSGVPFFINQKVVRADFRISISTINIHPSAGLSGGGKILLPGVAGLKTIESLHSLPPGKSGAKESAMRDLINELLDIVPISYSWHLVSNPDGGILKIIGGQLQDSFNRAIEALKPLITLSKPEKADLLLLSCKPFNQNLISTFKSLFQIPALLKIGGTVILFNEAPQGTGSHHWRMQPEIVSTQKRHYQELLKNYQVALFSPLTAPDDFKLLFPETFSLLKSPDNLIKFINSANSKIVTVLPYAPVTLLE